MNQEGLLSDEARRRQLLKELFEVEQRLQKYSGPQNKREGTFRMVSQVLAQFGGEVEIDDVRGTLPVEPGKYWPAAKVDTILRMGVDFGRFDKTERGRFCLPWLNQY